MHARKSLVRFATVPVVAALLVCGAVPASADPGLPEIDVVVVPNDASGGSGGKVAYSRAYTGRDCQIEYGYNGQTYYEKGSRCAQAFNEYIRSSNVLWRIDDYYIRYDVSGGLDFGPHNNERSWTVAAGYHSGNQTYESPDSGGTNSGYFRRDQGTTYTYIGQTVINIDAWPDIPATADPRLDLDTAQF